MIEQGGSYFFRSLGLDWSGGGGWGVGGEWGQRFGESESGESGMLLEPSHLDSS